MFEQVALGAGPDGVDGIFVVGVHGQHDDLGFRVPGDDHLSGLDTVHFGH